MSSIRVGILIISVIPLGKTLSGLEIISHHTNYYDEPLPPELICSLVRAATNSPIMTGLLYTRYPLTILQYISLIRIS